MSTGHSGRRRSSAEIRADIEATRARVAADIDAARTKLSRRGLEREALGALRGVRHEASGALGGLSHTADRQANQFSRIAVDTIKRYPVATTLVGLAVALLAFNGARGSRQVNGPGNEEKEMALVKPPTAVDLPSSRF